ncbi:SIS domain-containing protein [Lipingzhangella sp. LS1_29]|uniref:SIS domain-containing protein n=1 Tax=Lipingzhangella rawalii TaxID=2055835 RepID=A0ABU2H158_9ACTN|nr:SIS domain-containing protein [Lipingzhangella rawalii]MDS1269038.1 SIS domain-containing protein [Lipingzhangella rawalii]
MWDWIASAAAGERVGQAATRVLEVLGQEPRFASYASAAALAERAGVNAATVVRTAQLLGFTGWPELRLELRSRYLASLSAGEVLAEHAEAAGESGDLVHAAISADQANLGMLATTVDATAVRAIAAAMHAAGTTVALGSGAFAAPGVQLAHVAAIMGYAAVSRQGGGTSLINDLRRLGGGDCLVVCDLWRLPREIATAGRLAAERGATVAVLTDRRDSSLARNAAHVVVVPSEGVSLYPALAATMSVVHAILAELARLGGQRALESVAETERLWEQAELF